MLNEIKVKQLQQLIIKENHLHNTNHRKTHTHQSDM